MLGQVYRAFASFGMAIILLLLLFMLTALGTWAQRFQSLHEVQRLYFESFVVVDHSFGFPLPLPGVNLLLSLLALNLIMGGFIRIRKSLATVGVMVIHTGIMLLLVAGLVEYHLSTKGHMTLYEGENADTYQSYYEWEITLAKVGGRLELVVPGNTFISLMPGRTASYDLEGLPFRLEVEDVHRNCHVVPSQRRSMDDKLPVVNGFFIQPLPPEKDGERNVAGAYIRVVEKSSGRRQEGIVWGSQNGPLILDIDDGRYAINMHHRKWEVPFNIKLVDFRRDLHPRTGGMAKAFESDVVKTEDDAATQITISMNEPLRRKGYTFFQASWGPGNAAPGDRLYSTFAVVKNPADQWPLYGCIIIAVGLLLQFTRKLTRYAKNQRKRALES
ncbi:cytochrome c biogenesis protein ResB [bacterium AH-315-F18]|nr:cytochrome c biogenesis protein ResB [bacterium AH-315-F18]